MSKNNRIGNYLQTECGQYRALQCAHAYPFAVLTACVVVRVGRTSLTVDNHMDCICCGPYVEVADIPKQKGMKFRRGQVLEQFNLGDS